MNYKALFAFTATVLMALAAFAVVSDSSQAESDNEIKSIKYSEPKLLLIDLGADAGTQLKFKADGVNFIVDDEKASLSVPAYLASYKSYVGVLSQKVDPDTQAMSLSLTTDTGVTYTYNTYKITVNEAVNGKVTADKTVAKAGDTVNLTVKANDGYEPSGEPTVSGVEIVTKTVDGYSFVMPEKAVTISATFTEIKEDTYTVKIADASNGRVTAEPNKNVKKGTEVILTATPKEKYTLKTLTVTDSEGKPVKVESNKFTMPGSNVTVTAVFEPQVGCTVTFDEKIITVMNGSEKLSSGTVVLSGTVVTVTIGKLGYTVTPELDTDGQYTVTKNVEFKAVEKEYEDASFSGSILTSTEFGENQLVTVPKDSVLQNGTTITINGKLYVPAGITVKVSAGAELIINGIADIQGNLEVEAADNDSTPVKKAGEFAVEGKGEATISGTVDVDGVFATYGDGRIVIKSAAEVAGEVFGNIEVSGDASLTVTGLISGKKSVTTCSDLEFTVFTVYGDLIVSSDVPTIGFEVDLKENGTVVIEKAVLGTAASQIGSADGTITITDGGVVYYDKDDKNALGDAEDSTKNKVVIDGTITVKAGEGADQSKYKDFGYGVAVSGITVSTVTKVTKVTEDEHKDEMKHQAVMSVSGIISVADEIIYDQSENSPVADSFSADITATGSALKIDKDLSLGEKVAASFENVEVAAPVSFVKTLSLKNASIEGAVSVPAGAVLNLEGKIDVKAAVTANAKTTTPNAQSKIAVVEGSIITVIGDGSVATLDKFDVEKIKVNATMYGNIMYVSFDKALAALNAGTTKEVSAFGEQTLTASAEIPAGAVVKLMKSSKLNIGSKDSTDVVLTVASGTGILLRSNDSQGIEVYGTLEAVKASNVDSSLRGGKIFSDVSSCAFKTDGKTQDPNGFAKWTNIYAALDTAESGQTVTLQRSIEGLKSVTIKDGVTLDVNGNEVKVAQTAVLTVAGTLDLTDEGSKVVLAEPTKDEKEKVKTAGGAISYTGYIQYTGDAVPVTQKDLFLPGAYYTLAGTSTKVLTTYANGAADALKAEDYTVVLKADKDGKIALGEISFVGEKDKIVKISAEKAAVTGTVALAYADFDVVAESTVDAKFVSGTDSVAVKAKVGADRLCVENAVLGEAAVLMISGALTDIDTSKADTSVVFDGKVYLAKNFGSNVDKTTVNGDLVVCGVEKTSAKFETSVLDVVGNIVIQNRSSVSATELTVSGSIGIENGTLSATTAVVTGAIDAKAVDEDGASVAAATFGILYVGVDAEIAKRTISTGADASVVGNVSVSNYALFAPGLTAPESFTKENSGYESTLFVAEEKDYVVAYAAKNSKLVVGNINYEPENADFSYWKNAETGKSADAEAIGVPKVVAEIDYQIYSITITTDGGIAYITVDGKLMEGTEKANTFVIKKLVAGPHTVEISPAADYDISKVVLKDKEGKTVGSYGSMTVSLAGTEEADRTVSYQLIGSTPAVTPTPEPTPIIIKDDKDDGMSLTDILLIVLVVLIVIMAAIVALRMMRS